MTGAFSDKSSARRLRQSIGSAKTRFLSVLSVETACQAKSRKWCKRLTKGGFRGSFSKRGPQGLPGSGH